MVVEIRAEAVEETIVRGEAVELVAVQNEVAAAVHADVNDAFDQAH